jgi:hypothetical protein
MAAAIYRAGLVGSLKAAAEGCGSTTSYIRAVLTVLASEDPVLINEVKKEWRPLLPAAREVKGRVALLKAYRQATPEDRIAVARIVGATVMFDDVIVPAAEAGVVGVEGAAYVA